MSRFGPSNVNAAPCPSPRPDELHAAAHVAVVSHEAFRHPVEVVVAVRDLLSIDGGGHGVAHEEHSHVDVVALGAIVPASRKALNGCSEP